MVAERRRGDADTATRILDVAERLAQMRGFNGFSYADIAAELGITKAALHYHFASKADLGEALIGRYAARFGEALAAIDAGTTAAPAKLRAYAELYADVLRNQRMCLCGMLAAEYQTLPGRDAGRRGQLLRPRTRPGSGRSRAGPQRRQPALHRSPRETARMIISCLEGAMLVTRPYGDIPRFQDAAASLITGLITPAAVQG